jgi:hypothetical protein
MIYIKCFENFEDDLGAITKKYGKSSYLSISTKEKLKQLRIPVNKFIETYEKVELIKGFKEDKDLLDNLLISLKDHFYDYPIRFADESSENDNSELFYINSFIKVYDKMNTESFKVFPFSKNTEDLVISIFSGLRLGKIKYLEKPSHLRKGERDYGSRTRKIRSSEFEEADISIGLNFLLNCWFVGEIGDTMLGDENYREISYKKYKIQEEILEYLKEHVIYRYFYILGYKNIDFDIRQDYSTYSYEIKINNI